MNVRRFRAVGWLALTALAGIPLALDLSMDSRAAPPANEQAQMPLLVLGYNDLGMHCMNEDFSTLCILPPYNTMHVQIIDRSGTEPHIVASGVTVRYSIPGNTRSHDKTNFWTYAPDLFGTALPTDVGLAGAGLAGTMTVDATGQWGIVGVPITPLTDAGRLNPYQLARITVTRNGVTAGKTQAVMPVSWEISCNLCHNTPGKSVDQDILNKHDQMHGTTLASKKPVLCAGCHADPALGAAGQTGVSTLSHAMHSAHAPRMAQANLKVDCYACHPGIRTQCQRDIHFAKGKVCTDCHGDMAAVGDPARRPWQDEPRCGNCHAVPGHEYEQPGLLFKQSQGHHGIHCSACHGSPHAITPAVQGADNVQAMTVQGQTGIIRDCTVCHQTAPGDPFDHVFSTGD